MLTQEKLYNTFIKLVSIESISGTKGEVEIGEELIKRLSSSNVSKNNTLTLRKIEIDNDEMGRFVVFGHLKGGHSKDTILLTAHLDVVDVDEFGSLKDLAFKPEELTKKIGKIPLSEDVIEDLNSNSWLFGRGVADMKFGLALNVELIEYFAGKDDFDGNLIFIALPGEETNSEGMRKAVEYLADYKEKYDLEYRLLLMSECFTFDSNNSDTHYIHYGAEGKVMPILLFVGQSTHANNPFGGIDSNMISSEFFNKFQLNLDIISECGGKWSEPPVCLKMKDFKEHYSAKPATFSLSYFNLPTIHPDYISIIEDIKKIANETLKLVIDKVNCKREEYNMITKSNIEKDDFKYTVITYEELYERAFKSTNGLIEEKINKIISDGFKNMTSIQDIAGEIMKLVYSYAEIEGISIVLGIAPPFYPSHLPKSDTVDHDNIKYVCDKLIEYSRDSLDVDMRVSEFYQVSDLSFVPLEEIETVETIYSNMPGNDKIYKLPIKEMNELKIPSIILGPRGKDFHKITERIDIDYALKKLPAMYFYIINLILSKKEGDNMK